MKEELTLKSKKLSLSIKMLSIEQKWNWETWEDHRPTILVLLIYNGYSSLYQQTLRRKLGLLKLIKMQ